MVNTATETIIKKNQGLDSEIKSKPREAIIDKLGRSYATGKRKNAIAKVWIKKGKGNIIVNGKPAEEYLKRAILNVIINQPFAVADMAGKFDVTVLTNGGGLSGQAGAIRHAIAIALQKFDPSLRGTLKTAGLLTRDSRIVERKKPGRKKARKGPTYRKR